MWKYLLGGEERQQKIKKHCASKGSSVPGSPAKAHFSATFQPRPVQPAQSSAEDALPALWNHRLPVMTERLRSLTNNAWGAAVPHLSAVTKTTNHHIFSCHLQDFPGAQLRQFHTGVHTSLWITMYTWVSPQHTKKKITASLKYYFSYQPIVWRWADVCWQAPVRLYMDGHGGCVCTYSNQWRPCGRAGYCTASELCGTP